MITLIIVAFSEKLNFNGEKSYLLKINDLYSKVVLLLLILLPPVWSVGLKIDLRVGSVQGGIEKVQGSADGKNYASFSGIPYAEPPVGKLRFKVCTYVNLSN